MRISGNEPSSVILSQTMRMVESLMIGIECYVLKRDTSIFLLKNEYLH